MRAVRYGAPAHLRAGATLPKSDRRPPAGLVGIPQSSGCRRPPHSRPLNPCGGVGVLVPPTGNGVLNQIPAGDGRESSREQVVPDDGALLLTSFLWSGARRPLPPRDSRGFSGRATSLTHQKKKKKKKSGRKQRWGWCGSGNYTRAVRWRLCECSGTEWKQRGNSGAHRAGGLHHQSESGSKRRMIQVRGKYRTQIREHQKESIIRNMSHRKWGRNEGIGREVERGAGSEGGCQSDWRERGLLEKEEKEEKKVILSHSTRPHNDPIGNSSMYARPV